MMPAQIKPLIPPKQTEAPPTLHFESPPVYVPPWQAFYFPPPLTTMQRIRRFVRVLTRQD
jgi:hypothetical protein